MLTNDLFCLIETLPAENFLLSPLLCYPFILPTGMSEDTSYADKYANCWKLANTIVLGRIEKSRFKLHLY